MSRSLRALGSVLLVASLAAAAAAAALWHLLKSPFQGYSSPSVLVTIPQGSTTVSILAALEDGGVVRDRRLAHFALRLLRGKTLKAGEYRFAGPLSPESVVAKLVAGDVVQHRITFPEGLAASEVFAILAEKGFGKEAEYERLFVRPGLFPEIPTTAPSLEGFLFPDTYVLTRSLSPREIVTLFVRQLRRRLPRGFEDEIKGRGLSLLEAVTVASLVEKETALAEERSLVSAVYLNRLSRGMLLQCDPTTIYSLKRLGAFRGSLLQRDLSAPDPYNTYVHAGLPPGPICNPGLASLEAAARPAKSTYLFFVAAGDGSHRFASDGEAHGRNVALWRRTQRERGQARTVR